MEEGLNGQFKDEVHQNVEDRIKAEIDDETLRIGTIVVEGFEVDVDRVENGKKDMDLASSSSSSSSSDDEEAEIIVTEKTDEDEAEVLITENTDDETGFTVTEISNKESKASDLTVEEAAAEIEPSPITEDLKVAEVIDEDISEALVIADEEEMKVIITEESPTVEAVAAEHAVVVSEVFSTVVKETEVEYADPEGTNGKLQSAGEDNFPANAKTSNGTDDTNPKTDIPETNGNPQIISISARTMQPTSWKGCCGLLEVFKRGDR